MIHRRRCRHLHRNRRQIRAARSSHRDRCLRRACRHRRLRSPVPSPKSPRVATTAIATTAVLATAACIIVVGTILVVESHRPATTIRARGRCGENLLPSARLHNRLFLDAGELRIRLRVL